MPGRIASMAYDTMAWIGMLVTLFVCAGGVLYATAGDPGETPHGRFETLAARLRPAAEVDGRPPMPPGSLDYDCLVRRLVASEKAR